MFYTYNYFRKHNENREITDYKTFYKKFSNEREFGGSHTSMDKLIANRFLDTTGHLINIFLRKMPEKVLDVGCGAGLYLPLSNYFPNIQYTGVDYAEKALESAKKDYKRVVFEVADAFSLRCKEKYDIIILSSLLILYEEKNDRQSILKSAHSCLAENGLMIVIVWNDSFLLRWSIKLSRIIAAIKGVDLPKDFMGIHFSENEIKKEIFDVGLSLIDCTHTSSRYGALESVRYLNMKKYNRDYSSEKELSVKKRRQNELDDFIDEAGTPFLSKIFFNLSKIIPSSLSMYSIYVIEN